MHRILINYYHKLSLLCLLLIASRAASANANVCKESLGGNVDFICGDITEPAEVVPGCDRFSFRDGSNSTNTMLWFLGEEHHQSSKTAACIEVLTKSHPVHRIFLEGLAANQKMTCSNSALGIPNRKDRQCIGWDNDKALSKVLSFYQSQNVETACFPGWKSLYASFEDRDKDQLFDRALKQVIDHPERNILTQDPGMTKSRIDCFIDTAKWILKKRGKNQSYPTIFNDKNYANDGGPVSVSMSQFLAKKNAEGLRVLSLFNTLNKSPSNTLRIVVIGKVHIYADDMLDSANAEAFQASLAKHNEPYAVLTMD